MDDYADLIAQLRLIVAWHTPGGKIPAGRQPDRGTICSKAADALATLVAELATLRAATASVQADQRAELARVTAERDALRKAGIEFAAALAQRKPLHALSHLSEVTHIGHRQFARAYEQADEDTRLMAIALREAIDAARRTEQEQQP